MTSSEEFPIYLTLCFEVTGFLKEINAVEFGVIFYVVEWGDILCSRMGVILYVEELD